MLEDKVTVLIFRIHGMEIIYNFHFLPILCTYGTKNVQLPSLWKKFNSSCIQPLSILDVQFFKWRGLCPPYLPNAGRREPKLSY